MDCGQSEKLSILDDKCKEFFKEHTFGIVS